jgi:hypothetical protein
MKTLLILSVGALVACGPVGPSATTAKCGGVVPYFTGTSTRILALGMVEERLVVLTSNGGLVVHDPADFTNLGAAPKVVGAVSVMPGLSGSSEGTMLISGTTAYVFIEGQGTVVNLSDVTSPVVTATGNTGPAYVVVENDTSLITAAGMGFVRVLDKSNLAATPPAYLSLGASTIAVSGTMLAVVEQDSKRLSLYDLTTPTSPAPLGKLSLPQTARGLRFEGTTLYAYDHDTFMTVAVADPMNPRLLFEKGAAVTGRDVFPNVQSLWFSSTQLLVPGAALGSSNGNTGGVNLFDVSDPPAPKTVLDGLCGPSLDMRYMTRAGARLFIGNEKEFAFNDL